MKAIDAIRKAMQISDQSTLQLIEDMRDALLPGLCAPGRELQEVGVHRDAGYEFARLAPTVTTTFTWHAPGGGHATCCVLRSIGCTDARRSFSAIATWSASLRLVVPGR